MCVTFFLGLVPCLVGGSVGWSVGWQHPHHPVSLGPRASGLANHQSEPNNSRNHTRRQTSSRQTRSTAQKTAPSKWICFTTENMGTGFPANCRNRHPWRGVAGIPFKLHSLHQNGQMDLSPRFETTHGKQTPALHEPGHEYALNDHRCPCGLFWWKRRWPGLPGGLIIHQGHLFAPKGHLCK